MLVYSVASEQSFEMIQVIRDKILNHLVSRPTMTCLVRHAQLTAAQGLGMGADGHRGEQE